MTTFERWTTYQMHGPAYDMWRYVYDRPGTTKAELRLAFAYVSDINFRNNLHRLCFRGWLKRVKLGHMQYSYTAKLVLLPKQTPPVFNAEFNLKRMQQNARIRYSYSNIFGVR